MRWLLIGIVWLYFLVLLVGPILYMASQSFSEEGLAAFWTNLGRRCTDLPSPRKSR